MLEMMMKDEVIPEAIGRFQLCYNALSVRSKKKLCGMDLPFTLFTYLILLSDQIHFNNGRFIAAPRMVKRKCPVVRQAWEPHDIDGQPPIRKIIIRFDGLHNHPAFPHHKLTMADKKAVDKAYLDANDPGITAQRLNNGTSYYFHGLCQYVAKGFLLAPSTRAANSGKTLAQAQPGLLNNRLLSDALNDTRKRTHPSGFGWEGVNKAYHDDQEEQPENRYYWTLNMVGSLHILVTMIPALAQHIHKAREIVCDFTFKRVTGNINEWEVVIFMGRRRSDAHHLISFLNIDRSNRGTSV